MIKDSKGKSHMVFDKDNSKEIELMGDNINDYEILQVLGEGSFGFVAKAKSKLNHKIYAVKQINFSNIKNDKIDKIKELSKNEIMILKNLNHPLITKYFKSIEEKENNCLYIIMEFMDNGDLNGLIKAHKILNKPIEEEKLWNIFIQAMTSLAYIHSKNLIHRDIKPENLFISNDGTIKLGDFGVSASVIEKNKNNFENAQKELISNWECKGTCVGTPPFMSPEMIKKAAYDLNTDVYSMGCTFFESMYWMFPRSPIMNVAALFGASSDLMKLVDIPIKYNKDYYSKELANIVSRMIEIDKNKRPSSQKVLEMLIHEFNKKYGQNSSIGSILCCLYCFKELTEYFTNENNANYINNNCNTLPICFSYLFGIKLITFQVNDDWNNCLCNIRSVIVNENERYDGNKEIEPRQILSFLLGKLHRELNKCKNRINKESNGPNQQNNFNFSNKIEVYNNFIKKFNENNKSIISDNFYGFMKTKTVCSKCKLTSYTYNSFIFVSFNLNLVQKKKLQQNYNQTNILECFSFQNNECLTLSKNYNCSNCKENTIHYQRKQFYSFPRFLIICLDRGSDCQNKMNVFYRLDINLKGYCDNSSSPLQFELIGIIKRMDRGEKEHYITIYFDFRLNSWIFRDDSNFIRINSPFEVNQGYEIMLFYIENKNINNSYIRKSSCCQFSSNISFNPSPLYNMNNGMNMSNMSNMNMNNMNMNNMKMNNMNMSNMNNMNNMNMNNMNMNNMNMNNMNNMNMNNMKMSNMNKNDMDNNNMNNNFNLKVSTNNNGMNSNKINNKGI